MDYLWLLAGLGLLAFLAYRAGRIWSDATRWASLPLQRLGWALRGAVAPSTYWWDARIDILPQEERVNLVAEETMALDLSRADGIRCPLCQSEVPKAWALDAAGKPSIRPGPVACPGCDFRLDACRHCVHFQVGTSSGWGQTSWIRDDLSSGRCSVYMTSQPVEQVSSPEMARRLKELGYETVRAPIPIKDSYLPPDHCTAFEPEQRRLKASEVGWPDARRAALLRLLAAPAETSVPSVRPSSKPVTSSEEQWLL